MDLLMQGIQNTTRGLIWNNIESDRAQNDYFDRSDNETMKNYYMANVNYDLNKKFWDATNVEAQMKHLENAGLSKGLMYKGSGLGGGTAGNSNQSGGSGGNPSAQSGGAGNINNALSRMADADVEAKKAQANKDNATADKLRGADTENTNSQTKLNDANREFREIEVEIAKDTKVDKTLEIEANARTRVAYMESAENQADIDQSTKNYQIKKIYEESIGAYLQNQLTISNTKVNYTKIKYAADEVAAMYINAFANRRNAGTNEINADANLKRQIGDKLYQMGILRQGDEKIEQQYIMGIMGILSGHTGTTTTYTQGSNSSGEFESSTKTIKN